MTMFIKTISAVAAGTMLATGAFAQSAKEVRGASPYAAIENEPAPKLIVDPPLPEALAQGVVWIQYRVENVRIVPVFGTGALKVSPTGGAFAHTRRRCALVVGGRERHQYNRHRRDATRPAQDSDRVGQCQPSGLPRMRDVQADGDVHSA